MDLAHMLLNLTLRLFLDQISFSRINYFKVASALLFSKRCFFLLTTVMNRYPFYMLLWNRVICLVT